jgi:hypothetical protein
MTYSQTQNTHLYRQIQDGYSKPSPITHIYVFNPSSQNQRQRNVVEVIADTGAGITSLPQEVIDALGPLQYTTINVRSPFDRNRQTAMGLYSVCLRIENGITHEIEVLGIPRKYGILGRDILNNYKIVLDAPNRRWGFNCCWPLARTGDSDNCIIPISSQNL